MSWSVRGVDNDAREKALEAAREAGMPVGEWLNSLILQGQADTHQDRAAGQGASPRVLQERLDRRLPSERSHGSARAVGSTSAGSDRDQLADIARALDSLLAASDGGAGRAAQTDIPRRDHRSDIPAAPRRTETPARMKRVERVLATLDNLDRRVRTLAGDDASPAQAEIPSPPGGKQAPPSREPVQRNLQSAIDEISARKDALRTQPVSETLAPSPAPTGSPTGYSEVDMATHFSALANRIDALRQPQGGEIDGLRSEISGLRDAIVNRERDGSSRRDLKDISRLTQLIEDMQTSPADPRALDSLRADIAELREAVIDNNLNGTLKTLEMGYGHIVQRLDDLRRQVDDPHLLHGLDGRLEEIERTLANLPRGNEFRQLEGRLEGLSGRIETAARNGLGNDEIGRLAREIGTLREAVEELDVRDVVRGIDDRLRSLGDRLDRTENMLEQAGTVGDRISAVEDRLPDAGVFDRLNHRLERICTMLTEDQSAERHDSVDARLSEIVGRLENIEKAPRQEPNYDHALALLEKRIDALTSKLDELDRAPIPGDALEAILARIDGALDRGTGAGRFDDLQAQISDLARQFAASGDASDHGESIGALQREIADLRENLTRPELLAEILEPQIQELAQTLLSGDRVSTDDASLARIEQQIALIAGQLDATEDRLSGLSDIEAALERLGTAGANADKPAQPSARQVSENDEVRTLRADLARLMKVAGAGQLEEDADAQEIREALNSIIARLTSIEEESVSEMRGHAQVAAGGMRHFAAAPAVAVDGGGGFRPQPAPQTIPQSSPIAPQTPNEVEPLSLEAGEIADDLPLEPGSGKPDLAALLRERGEHTRAAHAEDDSPRDRKADFIAAARRAAQAAAAEIAADEITSDTDTDAGEAKLGWLRGKLKGTESAKAPAVDPVASPAATEGKSPTAEGKPRGAFGRLFKSRRPIVLAAAAVILAIGALKLTTSGHVEKIANLIAKPSAPLELSQTPSQIQGSRAASEAPSLGPARASAVAPASMPDESVTFQPPAGTPGEFETSQAPAPSSSEGPRRPALPAKAAENAQVPETGNGAQNPDARADLEALPATEPKAPMQVASIPTVPEEEITSPFSGVSAPAAATTLETDMGLSAPMPEVAVGPLSLRMAAADGNPRAQFEVAARYTEGRGVHADPAKAVEWYQRAAEGGLAPAQYRLGSMYEKGRGISKDLDKARQWYKRAADQGNAKAMHNLAVLYAGGGVDNPDFARATEWFQKASRLGVRDSQFNLGILYARGFGVAQDMIESYRWFSLAAQQGDTDAASKRDEVARQLNPQDLSAAELLVNTWSAATQNEAANTVALDPSWTEEPKQQTANASADLVLKAQLLLNELGYDTGPADGMPGPKTREAVRSFQKQAGLSVTGKVDSDLIRALSGRAI